MTRALITGINGQDGYYLSRILIGKDYDVYGLDISRNRDDDHYLVADVTDLRSLVGALRKAQPSEIYHLAAQSSVAVSHDEERSTTSINAYGLSYLVDACRETGIDLSKLRFCQASSSEIFGYHTQSPLSEVSPFAPETPYGRSKLIAHEYVRTLRSEGVFACNAILFNHESPRRTEAFVSQKIATGVAKIVAGLEEVITLGDTSIRRDWGFAGDYVEAMRLMLERDVPDDYVIASGEAHSISSFLECAFRHVGISDWESHVQVDQRFMRDVDATILYGNPDKAKRQLGWMPKTTFSQLVALMVDAAIERLGSSSTVNSDKTRRFN
jgi:GDPmannose 4,6-dehydratase